MSQFSYETFYRIFRAVRLSSKCKLIKRRAWVFFYPVVVQETTVEWVLGDTSHHQHDGAQPRRVYDWVDRGAREAGVVYVV